jgi:rhodanese-related sulfurtransferase
MRRLVVLFCALALGVVATGCGSSEPSETSAAAGDSGSAVIIDVRTPAEFAAGHLEGAANMDSASATLESDLNALDKDAEYQLYCRSGVRAGAVQQLMKDLGFTNVTSLGGMEQASDSTGIPIVS